MTHVDALNDMLANSCGIRSDEELRQNGNVQEFHFTLHCSAMTVLARPLGNLKYEIVSTEWRPE